MCHFLARSIEGDWPYLWLDATYVKVREPGRVVPVAVTIAAGVNGDGRREVLGMAIGASEAETFWLDFLRSLTRRSLRGVKLVISDAHDGLKAAVTKVLRATWQRCRVHFMRNATAHAGRTQRLLVSAWIGTAFVEADAPTTYAQWRRVADQLRPKVARLAESQLLMVPRPQRSILSAVRLRSGRSEQSASKSNLEMHRPPLYRVIFQLRMQTRRSGDSAWTTFQPFPPLQTHTSGTPVLSNESSGVLGHADDVELSLVWIDGELQEIPPSMPDMDHHWADVDLPILLTRAAAAFDV